MPHTMYRVNLLGALEVITPSGETVTFPGRKSAALFGYLCLEPGLAYSRELLAEALWPSLELKSKQTRLRQELMVLRRLCGSAEEGGLLISTRTSVGVRVKGVATDVSRFQSAWERSQTFPESAEPALAEMVSLFRGDLLESCDELGAVERRAVAQLFDKAIHQLVGLYERAGKYDEAILLLNRLGTRDPLDEEIHTELMRFYRLMKHPNSVWRQYQKMEKVWQSALGQAPAPHLRELALSLIQEAPEPNQATNLPESSSSISSVVVEPVLLSVPNKAPPRLHRFAARVGASLALIVCLLALWGTVRLGAKKSESLAAIQPAKIRWLYRDLPALGEKANSEAKAVALIPNGTLCVTGLIETEKQDVNILTLGFSPEGKLLWRDTYDSPGHDCDRAFSVVTGRDGSFFVAGESYLPEVPGRPEGWRLVVLKYSAQGERLWEFLSRERTENKGEHVRIVLDVQEGVYVGGTALEGERHSPLILHLDGRGQRLWAKTLAVTPEVPQAVFCALVADEAGNVYFCGTVQRKLATGNDWLVMSYSPTGALRWKRTVDGLGQGEDQAEALFVDRFGTLAVVGTGTGKPPVGIGLGMAKFSTNGEPLGVHWSTFTQRDLHFESASLSANHRRLTVAVSFTQVNGSVETLVEQYDEKGNTLWRKPLNAVAPDRSFAVKQVLTDPVGAVILTGLLSTQPQYTLQAQSTIIATHLSPEGDFENQQRFRSGVDWCDVPDAMTSLVDGTVVVVGKQHYISKETSALQVVAFHP
ncbi:BTAD domain-containing putative transcriptional regulator [Armatimonas sp.]|uniref:AfsR/SARP family transcriptional regulator n=1 Tax=Armatimonas sp. TaxID=1872638 RepID=UPI00286ABAC9|nr:BTAD domain-containing putative transcriptional regulator [Armatimonas sp.]